MQHSLAPASIETWQRHAAADLRTREAEEVLDVLRRTRDGDDLSAMDLRLAENVINAGLAAIGQQARARWAAVREMVDSGCYPYGSAGRMHCVER